MKRKIALIAGGAVVIVGLSVWLWYWHAYGGRAARLAESADPKDRLQAVRELRGKSGSLARRTLAKLPDDPDPKVARYAVRALGERPGPANRRALEQILVSPRPGPVRAEAAGALGKFPGADMTLLTRILGEDPDPAVRAGAATGLGARQDISALPALLVRLESDPDAKVRASCYAALRRILKVRFMYDPRGTPQKRRRQVDVIRSILTRYRLL